MLDRGRPAGHGIHHDEIEPELPADARMGVDPRLGRATDPPTLIAAEGVGPALHTGSPRLDLDEGDDVPVAGDEIQLEPSAAPVAAQDLEPAPLQKARGEPLAPAAEAGSGIAARRRCGPARQEPAGTAVRAIFRSRAPAMGTSSAMSASN